MKPRTPEAVANDLKAAERAWFDHRLSDSAYEACLDALYAEAELGGPEFREDVLALLRASRGLASVVAAADAVAFRR